MKFTIKGLTKEVPTSEVNSSPVLDIDFNGEYLIQVSKSDSGYKVTNAMNGWGQNCYAEFKDEVVIIEG